ncbi:MAG: D-tyrosyl-tRNA(Tyr) deacylase [Candidatus Marinimicrobia bacterium]|nr:D-tyrosyl-tRNA(Tyr) deacylase [Candidatus Neomarinimicrobiota bacterium]
MLIVVQRVKNSSVEIDGKLISKIEHGLNVLVGICEGDQREDAELLGDKIVNLRCFEDDQGKMNLSILDKRGSILSIPQFTLCADCTKGRRPSFNNAAHPTEAKELYNYFNEFIEQHDVQLETGRFGAYMEVNIGNDGPVTFVLDSKNMTP